MFDDGDIGVVANPEGGLGAAESSVYVTKLVEQGETLFAASVAVA